MGKWQFAAIRTVGVGGRLLSASLVSNADGDTGLMLHDAVTGALLGSEWMNDDLVYVDPQAHLSTVACGGSAYAVVRSLRSHFRVVELTLDGPRLVDWFSPDGLYVQAATAGWVDGHAVVVAENCRGVHAYRLTTAGPVGVGSQVLSGWRLGTLVRADGTVYGWLLDDDDRCWLWDAVAGVPVRPPVRVRGLRHGPWDLAGRPALLVMRWRRQYEVWDLALRERIDPPMPAAAHEMTAPCVGLLHGRRVLAAATGNRVRVWDLLTGRLVHGRELARRVLGIAVGDGGGLTVIDDRATVTILSVALRAVHPTGRIP